MKKILCGILCLWLVFAVCSCGFFEKPESKVFTVDELSITLDDSFESLDVDTQDAGFTSNKHNYAVTVLREDVSLLEEEGLDGSMSLTAYGETVIANYKLDATVQTQNGLTYFSYEKVIENTSFTYMATLYSSNDAYWLVQFACPSASFDKAQADFISYAQTVVFEATETL